MPNYNLTVNSTFSPFSFEEMLQPIMIAQAAHREVEDAYTDLSIKAGEYESLAESEKLRNGDSSETYKRYSTYANNLKSKAESLMKEGLTSSTRSSLMDLKRDYATRIEPIRKAAERNRALRDQRTQYEISNPTIRYERGYNEVGVDELLLNPDLDYGKSYSGSLIEQQSATAAAALAKNMREDPKGWQKILGNQYYQRKIQRGYTPEEVLLASLGDPNAPKELQEVMTKAIATSGVSNWEGFYDANGNITQRGQSLLNDVRSFAGRGLNAAIGGVEYERMSNKAYDYAMQAALKGGGDKRNNTPPKNSTKNPKMDIPMSKENIEKSEKLGENFPKGELDQKYTKKVTWSPTPISNIYDPTNNRYLTPAVQLKEEFVNPMQKYEEVHSRELPATNKFPTPYMVSPLVGKELHTNPGHPIISKSQYEALKELGYDSNSTAEDFSQLPQRIDESIQHESPISINLSNYNHEEDTLISRLNEDNMAGNIYEYDHGKLKKAASYDDIFKVDDNGTISFKNYAEFGVDPYNLDYLLMQTGGKIYSVRASLLYPEIKDILDSKIEGTNYSVREAYENGSPNDREQAIQALSFIYQDLMNSYNQRMPETSAQAQYGYPY